jgi:uncharacterized protein YbjT (DUF2867 family)
VRAGHSVRGTTRREERLSEIEAAGAQAVIADPDRLATLMPHIQDVSVVCWLLGSVEGEAGNALHGPRLESMLVKLVDTPVRGVVYEGPAGEVAARFADVFRMPVEVVDGQGAGEAVAKVLAA